MLCAQSSMQLDARLDVETDKIYVDQEMVYHNTSADTLRTLYFSDWNNSYSTKQTPLALRFAEEFSTKFHFAKSEERGYTAITEVISVAKHGEETIVDDMLEYLGSVEDKDAVQIKKELLDSGVKELKDINKEDHHENS